MLQSLFSHKSLFKSHFLREAYPDPPVSYTAFHHHISLSPCFAYMAPPPVYVTVLIHWLIIYPLEFKFHEERHCLGLIHNSLPSIQKNTCNIERIHMYLLLWNGYCSLIHVKEHTKKMLQLDWVARKQGRALLKIKYLSFGNTSNTERSGPRYSG